MSDLSGMHLADHLADEVSSMIRSYASVLLEEALERLICFRIRDVGCDDCLGGFLVILKKGWQRPGRPIKYTRHHSTCPRLCWG